MSLKRPWGVTSVCTGESRAGQNTVNSGALTSEGLNSVSVVK